MSDSIWAVYGEGAWELGAMRGSKLLIGDEQVIGARAPSIAATTGGVTIDPEAGTCIASILGALRAHGLIAS